MPRRPARPLAGLLALCAPGKMSGVDAIPTPAGRMGGLPLPLLDFMRLIIERLVALRLCQEFDQGAHKMRLISASNDRRAAASAERPIAGTINGGQLGARAMTFGTLPLFGTLPFGRRSSWRPVMGNMTTVEAKAFV